MKHRHILSEIEKHATNYIVSNENVQRRKDNYIYGMIRRQIPMESRNFYILHYDRLKMGEEKKK